MDIDKLLNTHGILSDQVDRAELKHLLQQFMAVQAAGVPGDVVEFGCYSGTTSVYLQRLMPADKKLHVYDSFQGLPAKRTEDESPAGLQFTAGELTASKAELKRNFLKAGLPLPVVHKAWFSELTEADIPPKISFAFLDGDYYESIKTPLKLLWPKLSPGSIVVVDDYQNEALPGAAKAVDEWLAHHNAKLRVQVSLAVMWPEIHT